MAAARGSFRRKRLSTVLVVLGIALWLAGSFAAPSATAAPKSDGPTAESDTGFTAPDGVVVSPTAENCNGMIPTSPSADHFKTLTGGTLEPAGTATYRITFPTGTEPFEIADCVLFAEPDEAGAYPAQLSSYDVLTKASFIGVATDAGQFDLDVSLQLPADIAVGTRVCNVAKSTEKRPLGDTAGGGHRKAGPACFIVGGDHRIEKHGSDTNGSPISADNPATFSFDCTNAAQDPSAQPLIISWTDASDDPQTHEIATASGSDLKVEANLIAVNGASGSSCTVTETTPPDGYDLPTDEADQSQTFTLGVGASQTVVTFVDPVQSCQTGCGSTTGSTDIEKRGTDTKGKPIVSSNPATFRFTDCVNADSETSFALSWVDATGASQQQDLGSATFPLDVKSNELTLEGATGSSCNVTETVAPKGYGLTGVSTAAPTKATVGSATDPVVFTNPVSQTCTTGCNSTTTTTTSTTVFVSTGNTTDENTRTTETPTTNPPPTVRVLSHELARTGSETRTYLTFAGLALLLGGVAVMFGEPSAAAARRGR